jgi:hypothetical protein
MINNIGNDKIEVVVTGDFCPIGRIEQYCIEEKYSEIYNDVLPYLQSSDLKITNLECPLTIEKNLINKIGPSLSAHPKCVEAIKYGGFNIVTLSNNHILDQGEKGVVDTTDLCNKFGIKTVGVGINLHEASQPLLLRIKSKIIAIINITENEFSIATTNSVGANPLNHITNHKQIKYARENSDYVLLILHGGIEHYNLPSPGMVEQCHFFADIGVDAIICHHTHCFSGYEIYNDKPIFYGLGNFIFDIKSVALEDWYKGFFIKLNINNNSFSLYPYYQNKNKIGLQLIKDNEKEIFFNEISRLSEIIKDENILLENWLAFCRSKESYYLKSVFSLNRFQKILYRSKIFKTKKLTKKSIASFYNKINCESHREVLLEILKNKLID